MAATIFQPSLPSVTVKDLEMVHRFHSGVANDGLRSKDPTVVTDVKWSVSTWDAVAYHVVGHLLAHVLDCVGVVHRDEQLEDVALEVRGQWKQRHLMPPQRCPAQA